MLFFLHMMFTANKIFRILAFSLLPTALLFSGCSMHPPSASGFMQAVEKSSGDKSSSNISVSAKKLYSNLSPDEWEMPLGIDYISANNGFAFGLGLLPSPYITFGEGNKYFAARTWISAVWAGAMLALLKAADNEDNTEEDEKEIADFAGVLMELFSGGISFIEQLPITNYVRIGIEEYIARNFWISHWKQEDFSNSEVGLGSFITINASQHHFSLEGRYGIIDFNVDKPRLTLSLIYTLSFGTK